MIPKGKPLDLAIKASKIMAWSRLEMKVYPMLRMLGMPWLQDIERQFVRFFQW